MRSLEQRFWAKVTKTSGCWIWSGATQKGYGCLQRGVRGEGLVRAHRLAWELANGPLPPGMHVLHSCDNRLCVRLDHLFVGTNGDNIADKTKKGRNGRKLTREQAYEIRKMPGKHRDIAALFGVTHRIVGHIKRGILWP